MPVDNLARVAGNDGAVRCRIRAALALPGALAPSPRFSSLCSRPPVTPVEHLPAGGVVRRSTAPPTVGFMSRVPVSSWTHASQSRAPEPLRWLSGRGRPGDTDGHDWDAGRRP